MTIRREPGFKSPFYAANKVYTVTFTLGTTVSHVLNVAMKFFDPDGVLETVKGAVQAYISSDAAGLVLSAAPSSGIAVGSHGLCLELIADQVFILICNASGLIDLNFSGAGTYYLNIILPDGSVVTSPAIVVT